jgi:CheY-like chemotaxis protein
MPAVSSDTCSRVLLVEDDPDNLDALCALLSERYAVVACESGAQALERIHDVKPDVVVLDIGMWPMDGLRCLVAIRAIPGYGDLPAVALTAFAREVERRRFLDGGFQVVVTKPVIDPDDLLAVIDRLLGASMRLDREQPCVEVPGRASGAQNRAGPE